MYISCHLGTQETWFATEVRLCFSVASRGSVHGIFSIVFETNSFEIKIILTFFSSRLTNGKINKYLKAE